MSATAKKLILVAVAVVAALALGEVVLRLVGYGRLTPQMNFGVNTRLALEQGRFLPDPDLFWKLPPHPRDAEIRAVQPDRPLPPATGRRRILVLGDSCSRLSQGVPPYSVLLNGLLGDDVEVWNAAVPGYTAWQGRAWLHKQLLAGGFDAVVVYFGWNDHWRTTGLTDPEYAGRLRGSSLRLAELFRRKPATAPLRLPPPDYHDTLAALVRDVQQTGARVILVAAPARLTREARQHLVQTHYLTGADDAVALHRQYLGLLQQTADETGADVLNAVGVFAALEDTRDLIMRDGIHLTDDGHRVMAAILHPALVDDGLRPVPATDALVGLARAATAAREQP